MIGSNLQKEVLFAEIRCRTGTCAENRGLSAIKSSKILGLIQLTRTTSQTPHSHHHPPTPLRRPGGLPGIAYGVSGRCVNHFVVCRKQKAPVEEALSHRGFKLCTSTINHPAGHPPTHVLPPVDHLFRRGRTGRGSSSPRVVNSSELSSSFS